MKPEAVRATTAFALLFLLLPGAHAQVKPARYEVLPVESRVYRQTVNVYVYTTPAAPASTVSLPVIYVPLATEKDRGSIDQLESMMQQGTIPYMRIVGIERTGKLMPVKEVTPALYVNPKDVEEVSLSDDDWFSRFINSEVVPAVEGAYRCNSFKALYIDEGTPLGKHLLTRRSGGFSAYLTPTPFVWFNGAGRSEPANSFLSYYSGLRQKEAYLLAAELDDYLDEVFLKTGRLPRTKE